MRTAEQLNAYEEVTQEKAERALELVTKLVYQNLSTFTNDFPASNSENGFYPKSDNTEWTTGFWTGQIWLSYETTLKQEFLAAGQLQVKSFLNRIEKKIDVNHHDMGFLYTPSCVAAYQLTHNKEAKKAALLAADNLIERFQEKGNFFQAWGELGAKENYRLIIDCLLNMPLLFWASEVSGKSQYAEKAKKHIETAMELLVREDYSTYHTYYFNPETGEPTKGVTHQGHRDGSAWSRGQAWGVYGAALAYKYVRNTHYIELFERITEFFLTHLPKDLIPYWDFDFDDGSPEPRDSSALAIAVCGMLEMSKYLSQDKKAYYQSIAKKLINALIDHCAVQSHQQSNGLLLHGTYARDSVHNPCTDRGVDECNTWGDYYYLEGLVRIVLKWKSYW